MMVELVRYRRERGLSALPARHEDTPLVLPLGKSMKRFTRSALHTIVKAILAGAATASRDRRICSNSIDFLLRVNLNPFPGNALVPA